VALFCQNAGRGEKGPKSRENDSEKGKISHIVTQRQKYTKENRSVYVDALIMFVYFSFDKIFKEAKFHLRGTEV